MCTTCGCCVADEIRIQMPGDLASMVTDVSTEAHYHNHSHPHHHYHYDERTIIDVE